MRSVSTASGSARAKGAPGAKKEGRERKRATSLFEGGQQSGACITSKVESTKAQGRNLAK